MNTNKYQSRITDTDNASSSYDTRLDDLVTGKPELSRWTVVSYNTRLIFIIVDFVSLCGLISFCGILGNIANIIVFVRQGFKDTMNISLFGLAIADLWCLITMLWCSMIFNPLWDNDDVPFDHLDLMYLSAGWPHVCFNRITSFITAFITLERCLCITQPLKVKTIITPARTKIFIVVIFVTMFMLFSPLYYANRLEWQFRMDRNRTILGIIYAEDRELVEQITLFGHSVAMSSISFVTVIVCTIILVVKLNQKTKWRQSAAAQTGPNPEAVSMKDKRVVKMVTFISTIFIMCFFPATIIFFFNAYEPEFSYDGQFQNIWFSVWSVAFVLETVNSSVNIFVYLNMSTKFRETFLQTFCRRMKK